MEMMLEILKTIQGYRTPLWDNFFIAVTMLGESSLLMLLVAYIYWCCDKKLGYLLAFSCLSSGIMNISLKSLFQVPRPFDLDPGIMPIRKETALGYSFPSGHAQTSATFLTALISNFRKGWFLVGGAILIMLAAFSRNYLGVHTPLDVIVGMFLGIGWFFIADKLWGILNKLRYNDARLILLGGVILLSLYFYRDLNYYKLSGLFTGFFLGYLLEKEKICFEVRAAWYQQVFKYTIGIAGLLIIQGGLKVILPPVLFCNFIRYFVMGSWMTLVAPAIFKKVSLRTKATSQ